MARLTNKQQLFVEAYLQCWNATEAARRAQYAHPGSQGHRLLKNVEIAAEIERRLAAVAMSADEVLGRLAEQARADIGQYIVIDEETGRPVVDLRRVQEDGKTHLIKAVRQTRHGINIELHDQQAALVHIGRHLQLFTDKVDFTSGGKPIQPTVHIYMPANGRDDHT